MPQIYILLGADNFSKKEFIQELKQQNSAEIFELEEAAAQKIIVEAMNSGLFEKKKILLVRGFFAKNTEDNAEFLKDLSRSSSVVVFDEEKLDKRKTETKKLLANKSIIVKDFSVPQGAELRAWIAARAKKMELVLEPKALELFLIKIGADQPDADAELYNLWQVENELQKLKTFTGGKTITATDIDNLVSENISEDVFRMTNAITDGNKSLALKYLTNYLDKLAGADDKSKIIALSAILAEQFRGILMIQDFLARHMPDSAISKLTGYSPGRMFVYKKMARQFDAKKVPQLLTKFEALDQELKTSNSPASLQFLLIFFGAMNKSA